MLDPRQADPTRPAQVPDADPERAALPVCANPLCRGPVDLGGDDAVEVIRRRDGSQVRWIACSVPCFRTFLVLWDVKARAAAEARA